MKDVKFHFPYTSITLDRVEPWRAEGWQTYVRSGKVFTVSSGLTVYTINPAMLTFMEVTDRSENE